MYTRNITELLKRICLAILIICTMVVSVSGNFRLYGYATTRDLTPTISLLLNPIYEVINSITAPRNPTSTVMGMTINTVAPIVNSVTSDEVLTEPIVASDVTIQVEEVVVPEVVEEPVVAETPVVQEVASEPVYVSIEYPIGNEIDIVSTYDFSSVPLSEELMQATIDHCRKFEIPIPLALGLMDVESDFITTAGSQTSCYGLMQLHHKYFDVYSDPAQQIHDGLEFLASNLEKCDGDVMLALNIYNAGHITGNMSYSNMVMNDAAKWAEITGAPLTI